MWSYRISNRKATFPTGSIRETPRNDLLGLIQSCRSLGQSARDYIDSLDDQELSLLNTGIDELDACIGGGIDHGELIVIGARPGHGKTAIGMQMIHALAAQGLKTLVISEEMSIRQLAKRTLQFASPVPHHQWKVRREELRADIDSHFAKCSETHVVTDVGTAERAFEICQQAKEEHGIEAVLIDYVQLLQSKGRSKYEQVSNTSMTIATYRKEA